MIYAVVTPNLLPCFFKVFTSFGSVVGVGYLYDLCSYYFKPTPKLMSLILGVGYLYGVCSGYSKHTPKLLRSIQAPLCLVLGVGYLWDVFTCTILEVNYK